MKSILFTYKNLLFAFMVVGCLSCTEEIAFNTEDLESALVVEATITNENKVQKVLLSRTYKFESDGPNPESNAIVTLESSAGNYVFTEIEPGTYASEVFSAQPNIDYALNIVTSDGRSYSSTPTQLTTATSIGDLYVEREMDDTNRDGVSILVDSYDPTASSGYYRFEYEESYKVIAPKWRASDLIVIDPTWNDGMGCVVELVPKVDERRVCYAADTSNTLILGNTANLQQDRLSRFPVRRINLDNYIITHRYSILVRQYIQSREAYTYFETLQEFSENESIFSQNQPGFFNGNISSNTNSEEKVVGFFDVSFVSEKRIFFNFEDLFPGENRPPYVSQCFEFAPVRDQGHPTDLCGYLISGILNNEIAYWMENPVPESTETGPYLVVPLVCGDCTVLGANVPPEFWIE